MNFRRIQFLNGYRDIASDFSCFHETYISCIRKELVFLNIDGICVDFKIHLDFCKEWKETYVVMIGFCNCDGMHIQKSRHLYNIYSRL